MVLGHHQQHHNLISNMSGGSNLQPALQLALAAQLASPPRNRAWPPFFPMFAPLFRPHFPPQHNLLSISNNTTNSNTTSPNISSQHRNLQSPPSEDSNDERSEYELFLHENYPVSNTFLNFADGSFAYARWPVRSLLIHQMSWFVRVWLLRATN